MLRVNSENISIICLLTGDVCKNLITYYEENKNISENHFIDNNDMYDLHIEDYQK